MDIESLFTNIPLDETIDICVSSLYKESNTIEGFSKKDFHSLLTLSMNESFFTFDGDFYKQIDGVSMGSPLGPTFANAFLCHHEKKWLDDCPSEFKPVFYRRYVDDIFLLFRSSTDVEPFKTYMNSRHTNIRFTSEIEEDNKLSFLDVLISRDKDMFSTSVYRKPTFSGVFTNFLSFIPKSYKFSLIHTLLFRCYSLSSDFSKFHLEVENLKKILFKNGYSDSIVNFCIKRFLDKIYRPIPLPSYNVPKKQILFVLPFLGNSSLQTRSRLVKMFKKYLPCVELKIAFKSSMTIGSLFKFKDVFPKFLLSGVVYKYTCSGCNATYIGKTKRHLKVRACEHLGISPLTGKRKKLSAPSTIIDHILLAGHAGSIDDFQVIGRDSFNFRLEIKESLFISRDSPSLNKTITSAPLYLF